MEIIKQGVPPSQSVYRGTCSTCKCIIEVSEDEVVWEEDRGQDFPTWERCPTVGCKSLTIYLKEHKK